MMTIDETKKYEVPEEEIHWRESPPRLIKRGDYMLAQYEGTDFRSYLVEDLKITHGHYEIFPTILVELCLKHPKTGEFVYFSYYDEYGFPYFFFRDNNKEEKGMFGESLPDEELSKSYLCSHDSSQLCYINDYKGLSFEEDDEYYYDPFSYPWHNYLFYFLCYLGELKDEEAKAYIESAKGKRLGSLSFERVKKIDEWQDEEREEKQFERDYPLFVETISKAVEAKELGHAYDSIEKSFVLEGDRGESYYHQDKPIHTLKEIEVVCGSSLSVARQYAKQGLKVAVVDFANPCSHYVPDSKVKPRLDSQEGSLIRNTNLSLIFTSELDDFFTSMEKRKEKGEINELGVDDCMYIPDVRVFREDTKEGKLLSEEERYNIDVIVSCPPDYHFSCRREATYRYVQNDHVIYCKMKNLFKLLQKHPVDVLVLGTYGCGGKNNYPSDVVSGIHQAIQECDIAASKIVFPLHESADEDTRTAFFPNPFSLPKAKEPK